MSCLSTSDHAVAVGGALVKQVELPVEPQRSCTQPWTANRWMAVLLHALHNQGLDDGSSEVKSGEWLRCYVYFSVEYVAIHSSTLEKVKEHLPPPFECLPYEGVVHAVLVIPVYSIHRVVVLVDSYWLPHHLPLAVMYIHHRSAAQRAEYDHRCLLGLRPPCHDH